MQALGQPAEAERALRFAVELEPGNPDFLFALGDHYLKRGMGREARAVAERLIAEYPDQPVGHQLRAAAERLDIR